PLPPPRSLHRPPPLRAVGLMYRAVVLACLWPAMCWRPGRFAAVTPTARPDRKTRNSLRAARRRSSDDEGEALVITGRMVVVDPHHWLLEDGSLPTENLRLRRRALRIARTIEYGGPLRRGETRETLVEHQEAGREAVHRYPLGREDRPRR